MAVTLCFNCDKPFYIRPPDENNLCPSCKEEVEKKRLKEIAELYDIPFKERL